MLVAAGLAALQTPVAGALATAAGLGLTGLVFTAVAGVTAQLTGNARPATGLAAAALGAAYLLRAVGDSSGHGVLSWLSWISPIGWAQQTRPYAGERWGVLVVPVVVAAVLGTAAVGLEGRRDFAGSLLRPRLGPARVPAQLASPIGLAWRLERGGFAAWAVGSAAIGAVANGVLDLLRGNAALEQMLQRMGGEQNLIDAFFATIMSLTNGHGGHHPRGAVDAARRGNRIARRASARHRSESAALCREPPRPGTPRATGAHGARRGGGGGAVRGHLRPRWTGMARAGERCPVRAGDVGAGWGRDGADRAAEAVHHRRLGTAGRLRRSG